MRLTNGVPGAYKSAARGRQAAERGPQGFPSARSCPASSLRQPFVGVSLVGGALRSGTIGQGPLHIWDGGGLARLTSPGWPVSQLARLHQARRFPSSPGFGGRPPGQTPARGAGFPAPPTFPGLPPDGARFRRPPGPNTRTRCRFPSSPHVPGVSSEWCPFPAVNEFLLLSRGAAQAPRQNN